MRTDKPEANKLQDWVTREALPTIRKDGLYVLGEEKGPNRTYQPLGNGIPIFLRHALLDCLSIGWERR